MNRDDKIADDDHEMMIEIVLEMKEQKQKILSEMMENYEMIQSQFFKEISGIVTQEETGQSDKEEKNTEEKKENDDESKVLVVIWMMELSADHTRLSRKKKNQ